MDEIKEEWENLVGKIVCKIRGEIRIKRKRGKIERRRWEEDEKDCEKGREGKGKMWCGD